MVKNELLKKPDTRTVKPEQRVQSGCEAERYPRYGTGGSPGEKVFDKWGNLWYHFSVDKNMKGKDGYVREAVYTI